MEIKSVSIEEYDAFYTTLPADARVSVYEIEGGISDENDRVAQAVIASAWRKADKAGSDIVSCEYNTRGGVWTRYLSVEVPNGVAA